MLARYFTTVEATDISEQQIANAEPSANVSYSVQPAHHTVFPADHFDLVTVAQALHWLPFDAFFEEVKRVSKPGAFIAAWMYDLPSVSRQVDEIVKVFYSETLQGCWDSERKHVDSHYRDIPWPFDEIICPLFYTEVEMTAEAFTGYIGTWSAVRHFIKKNDHDPVDAFAKAIQPFWTTGKMTVRFPLYLRMGKVLK
jgi:ubiquinone/menaquinone biosynthesis C-methylase UbiE